MRAAERRGNPVLPVAQGTAGAQDRGRLEKGWRVNMRVQSDAPGCKRTTQRSLARGFCRGVGKHYGTRGSVESGFWP